MVKDCIAQAEASLAGRGRVLIGVTTEGEDAGEVEQVVDRICDAVRAAA